MSSGDLIVRGGAALIGPDLVPLDDAAIAVGGETIAQVGRSDEVEPTEGTTEVHVPELTLVPGFIDSHVHIGFVRPPDVLIGGVTTARDLAWPPERIFPLVGDSAAADYRGPTIIAAGPMLTVPGGYPLAAAWAPAGTGLPVASPHEATAAVARTAGEGAAVIKVGLDASVGPTLPPELLNVIVDAAHGRGLKVTAHIAGLDELVKAVEAGVDELAHMLMSPDEIPEKLIQRMVEKGVAIVPTLSVRFDRDLAIATDNLARFLHAGGRVIYGTDLGNAGPGPGIEVREIAAMAGAGMQARDIVRSATVDAARWLGLTHAGVLAAGLHADIVGLGGDPTRDIGALTKVELVIRRGRVVRAPG